ncbi:hypothetical protein M433DRAFT_410635 [Acidomyces richmondensis BFW]|nr:MAG: hypothetical protein FE78DRAFT_498346 [Acidomyces sp. 'richmondensis']KYG48536.1 hypothetical protein M433DRAFT_410635 [Acidomyces richmondensis BFW]
MPSKSAPKVSQHKSKSPSQEELDSINEYLKFKAQLQIQKENKTFDPSETKYDGECSESLREGLKIVASFRKESTTS